MIKLLPLLLIGLGVFAVWQLFRSRIAGALDDGGRVLENDQVDLVSQRLAESAGVETVTIHLLDSPIVNAYATPGGRIYLSQGMFGQFRSGRVSAPEIASVIAHELGHLALGHTRRRMFDVYMAETMRLIVGGLIGRLIPIVGWYLASWLSAMFVARLSRQDEFEADAYATALMLRSGFGTAPQITMLEKVGALHPPGKDSGQVSWLSSHPPIEQRIDAIRDNTRRWET